jgi:hypothetical protein
MQLAISNKSQIKVYMNIRAMAYRCMAIDLKK